VLSFNGGKDCLVILYLYSMIMKTNENAVLALNKVGSWWITTLIEEQNFESLNLKIVFFDFKPEDEFKEMLEFISQTEDYLGI